MAEHVYDVIVAGAGFSGAAAAYVLSQAGLNVAILEGRDRVGGRALTRTFAGTSTKLEFGGSWIAPWHHRVRHYAGLSEFRLRPTQPVRERRWHDGEHLLTDGPATPDDMQAYEAGLSRLRADVRSLATGHRKDQFGLPLVDVSMNGYLHRIGASLPFRAQILAWWCISGNGNPNRISAAEFLSSCAHGNGTPEGMMDSLAHTIEPGAQDLVASIVDMSEATVILGAPIEDVRQFRSDVLVGCGNGERYRARALIVALPLNALKTVRFAPALARRKTHAIAMGHGGRAFKLWVEVRGVELGALATGGLSGLQWIFAERETDDGTVVLVGFGIFDGLFNPASPRDVEKGVTQFFPDAEIVRSDWHDWVGDPYSRGTWLALPADAAWIGDAAEWGSEGRVFHASADFAPGLPGWFESAIESGEAVARQLLHQFAGA